MNTRGYWGFGSLERSGSAVVLPWFTVDFRELRQDCQNPGGVLPPRGRRWSRPIDARRPQPQDTGLTVFLGGLFLQASFAARMPPRGEGAGTKLALSLLVHCANPRQGSPDARLVPKAAVGILRAMPEESTTPDLVERTRRVAAAAGKRDIDALARFYAPDKRFQPVRLPQEVGLPRKSRCWGDME
jgi:hypothetical protein